MGPFGRVERKGRRVGVGGWRGKAKGEAEAVAEVGEVGVCGVGMEDLEAAAEEEEGGGLLARLEVPLAIGDEWEFFENFAKKERKKAVQRDLTYWLTNSLPLTHPSATLVVSIYLEKLIVGQLKSPTSKNLATFSFLLFSFLPSSFHSFSREQRGHVSIYIFAYLLNLNGQMR